MTHEERAKAWKREDISRRREAAHIEENFGRPYSDQDSHDSLAEQFREVGKLAVAATLAECEKSHAEEMREVVRSGDALRSNRIGPVKGCECGGCETVRAWDAATRGIQRG